MKKIKVAVLFGGRSAEHEVSVVSAKNIIASLNKKKYDVVPIGIDRQGKWHLVSGAKSLTSGQKYHQLVSQTSSSLEPTNVARSHKIDVVFPVLHGPFGEDGTIQGLLKLANLPFVGAGVLGSALGMDKEVQKRLLRDASIPVAKFIVLSTVSHEPVLPFGYPVFIKPANLGSSVGVTKVKRAKDLPRAVKKAFQYDQKVLIEEAIEGREIEVSVLGNEEAIASTVGEVIPQGKHEFYDYEAKYLDENGAKLLIPAKLSPGLVKKIQQTAIAAYKALCCKGMARVDMFLTKKGKVYVNEINTIPGFTNISMYPKLWEASGLPQTKLLDKLITLALDRFKKESKLQTSF